MSRLRVLGAVTVLAITGCVAAAQTPVTSIFQDPASVIPNWQFVGVSEAQSQTSSDLFNSGQLTGTWTPASRDVDPLFSLDMGTQTLLLNPSGGTNLNGDSPLFLADLDFGEQGTLVKWGVIVTAIPEPSTWALMGLGGMALGMRFMRRRVFS